MEYVAVERRAQRFGAGEHADQRHLRLRDDGQVRHAGRRAHVPEQGEYLVLLDELLARGRRHRWFIAVVLGDELELAAVHAAVLVDVVQISLDAVSHLDAELGGRTAEDSGLPEQDPVHGDAILGGRQRRKNGGPRQQPGSRVFHTLTSRNASSWISAATSSSFQTFPSASS